MARSALLSLILLLFSAGARADVSYPGRPGPREFIYDGARLLTAADAALVKSAADRLLTDTNIVLVVATIDSMATYGAGGWPIERYAMNLFDEWGLGSAEHNYGILLLVSKGDRKARIELGKAYNRERDEQATAIMQTAIIPRFKRGDFSGGIREGVAALDAMAREARPAPRAASPGGAMPAAPSATPAPPRPPTFAGLNLKSLIGPLACVGIGVVALIAVVIFAARRSSAGDGSSAGLGGLGGLSGLGGRGWRSAGGYGYGGMPPWWWWLGSGWGGFGGGGSGTSRRETSSSSGGSVWGGFSGGSFGGSSGGSFGGGFSGGGGATGSW